MENAPAIILFWYAAIALIILTLAFMTAAILLLKRSRGANARLWGRVCLVLSVICGLPILLVVGYILYIYIS